jgi:hypothetical protein
MMPAATIILSNPASGARIAVARIDFRSDDVARIF